MAPLVDSVVLFMLGVVPNVLGFNLCNEAVRKERLLPHFEDEGTEAMGGEATCPRTHRQAGAELKFEPRSPGSGPFF